MQSSRVDGPPAPCAHYCNPLNLNYKVQHPNSGDPGVDTSVWLREGADPSIAIFRDTYFLFSSKNDHYWRSRDLIDWEPLTPSSPTTLPILMNYAPTAVVIGDTVYLKDGNGRGLVHRTTNPDDPDSWESMPGTDWYLPDAQFFLNDDGRLWIAYGCSGSGIITLQELDVRTFLPIGTPYPFMMPDFSNRGWERPGPNNAYERHGWVEGAQLLKHRNRYYLIYSCPALDTT